MRSDEPSNASSARRNLHSVLADDVCAVRQLALENAFRIAAPETHCGDAEHT